MANVRDFGAKGDGKTDDTAAIMHAAGQGDGQLQFPRGEYRITSSLRLELEKTRRIGIDGAGGTAKLIMAGTGPALQLIGTHDKTAAPADFAPNVWANQRMPIVQNIELEGQHPDADGILVDGVMQPTFAGVLIREMRHGIVLTRRARNLLISHCHIYNLRGVGVYLDHVNLHQAIISGSHISYCLSGGIKIVGSEIRNLQITGNDIEYNYDPAAESSADVCIDATENGSSVREATICSNTIQAKASPGGANIRITGFNPQQNQKAGLLTITGNLLGSQEVNVHLLACRGVVLSGNVIYSGHVRNILVQGSRSVVMSGNCLDHNPDYKSDELCIGVRLEESEDCTFTGSVLHDCRAGQHTVKGARPAARQGLLEIDRCQRITLADCQVLDGAPHGIFVRDSRLVSISGCTVLDERTEKHMQHAIVFAGMGGGSFVHGNTLGDGTGAALSLAKESGVHVGDNLVLGG